MTEQKPQKSTHSKAAKIAVAFFAAGVLLYSSIFYVMNTLTPQERVRATPYSSDITKIQSLLKACKPEQKLTFIIDGQKFHPMAMIVASFKPVPPVDNLGDICSTPVEVNQLQIGIPILLDNSPQVVKDYAHWWVHKKLPGTILIQPSVDIDHVDFILRNFLNDYNSPSRSSLSTFGTPEEISGVPVPEETKIIWYRLYTQSYLAIEHKNIFVDAYRCNGRVILDSGTFPEGLSCWNSDLLKEIELSITFFFEISSQISAPRPRGDQRFITYPLEDFLSIKQPTIDYIRSLREAP